MNEDRKNSLAAIETEIKLLINQRLYEKKKISPELFEQAKVLILKPARKSNPAKSGKIEGGSKKLLTKI